LTKDLARAIASNLTAMKLLVTNIQADAEISGSSAVDIVERAVYYLKEKGKLPLPVPTLSRTTSSTTRRSLRRMLTRDMCRLDISKRLKIRGWCGSDITRMASAAGTMRRK
jgi:hypothetical protein